jgi:hypothetical protein
MFDEKSDKMSPNIANIATRAIGGIFVKTTSKSQQDNTIIMK